MAPRLELHNLLSSLLGNNHVYFQPPPSVKMEYPCIVYTRSSQVSRFADGRPYFRKKEYTVTVIDRDPDSEIPDKVADLPLCTFERFFTTESLNHDVFRLFF